MVKKTTKCVDSDSEVDSDIELDSDELFMLDSDVELDEEIVEVVELEKKPEIPIPGITLFYGKTNSGKTNLIKVLLQENHPNFGAIFVFTGTIDASSDYNFMDKRFVYAIDEKTDEKIRVILDNATISKQKYKEHTLIILDDCFNEKFHNSKLWDRLATCRHNGLSIWVSTQHATKVSPILRENASLCFITKLSRDNLEKLYKFSYGFQTKKDFLDYAERVELGTVFWNDLRNAHNLSCYGLMKVDKASKKFRIKVE
jgi:hypothetical protein